MLEETEQSGPTLANRPDQEESAKTGEPNTILTGDQKRAEILRAAKLLMAPGDVHEVRIPNGGSRGIIAGCFDDPEKLADAVLAIDGTVPGIYATLNLVNRAADNRLINHAETTAKDEDIIRRRWLMIDFDPHRDGGSSTEREHLLALSAAIQVREAFVKEGFPDPVLTDSGNGAHLLYRLDLPNDEVSTHFVKCVLAKAKASCTVQGVIVDQGVANASRITKLYGTMTGKGRNTPERPHRRSRLIEVPETLAVLTPAIFDPRAPIDNRVPIDQIFERALEELKNNGERNQCGLWFLAQLRDNKYSKNESILEETRFVKAMNEGAPKADRYTARAFRATLAQVFRKEPRAAWSQKTAAFLHTADGLYAAGEDGPFKISSPIEVTALGSEGRTQGFRLVRLIDHDGEQREIALGSEGLSGDKAGFAERLLEEGVRIEVGREKTLLQYLRNTPVDARFRVTTRTGWNEDCFVLPDEIFGQRPELRLLFCGMSEHRFKSAGTLSEWQEHVSKLCVGNSRLTFAVSCAFAGPSLPLLNSSGAGFHFRGVTSCGKSTALKVAGSVLGGGDGDKGFLRSWNSTLNGLESVAKLHNHTLLLLDEIGEANPKTAGAAAYSLVNGQGRERMKSDLTRREASRWTLVLLSSGEKSLADMATEAGQKIKGGQEIRLLDIPADAGAGFGIFEDLHGMTAKGLAVALGEASCRYYGTAFREWLRMLVERRAPLAERARELVKAFDVPGDASPEVGRAGAWFALMGAAGELAAHITLWPEGEAMHGAEACFRAWLDGRAAGAGQSDDEAGIAAVRLFLELHGASRFEDADWGGEYPQRVINRAGVRRGNAFWITPEVFKIEVCRGFSNDAVAKALAKRGFLVRDGRNFTKKYPAGQRARHYVVLDSIFSGEAQQMPLIPGEAA